MKNRLPLIVAALFVVTLACSFDSGASQPEATLAPTQEVTSIPVTATEAAPATALPSLAPTQEPTQPALSEAGVVPQITLPPAVEGPETLDLTSSALFQHPLTEYTEHILMVISGTDQNGQALDLTDERAVRFQTIPSTAWYKTARSIFDDAPLDSAMLDSTQYTVSADGQCTQSEAGDPPQRVFSLLGAAFTGQAQRVEAGVMVNGLIADRYELTAANLVPDAQIELVETVKDGDSSSTNTTTIKITGVGSLYLAREGSFVIKIELSASKTAAEEDFFFTPGTEMTNKTFFEMLPSAAGEALIAPPGACAGDSSNDPGGDDPSAGDPGAAADWPMLGDASMIIKEGSELVYQTYYSMDDVAAFYKTEMAALGWNLTGETNLAGTIINLIFSKDGQEVNITLLQTGDTVTVTVSQ